MPPKSRVEQAARLLVRVPAGLKLKVTQSMMAKGFSKKEVANQTMQQRVRCCAKELVHSSNDQQPTPSIHSNPLKPSVINATASSQSTSSNNVDNVSEITELTLPPKPKQLCKTLLQAKQYRTNMLKKTHKQGSQTCYCLVC